TEAAILDVRAEVLFLLLREPHELVPREVEEGIPREVVRVEGDDLFARVDLRARVFDHRVQEVRRHLRVGVPVARLVAGAGEGEAVRRGEELVRESGRRGDGDAEGLERVASCAAHGAAYTASESDANVKSVTFSVGKYRLEPRPCSLVMTRRLGPMASMLRSIFTGVSFQRKFFTGLVIFPFSMRKSPSRVRPVKRQVCGS